VQANPPKRHGCDFGWDEAMEISMAKGTGETMVIEAATIWKNCD
jgi:hypothetical protein